MMKKVVLGLTIAVMVAVAGCATTGSNDGSSDLDGTWHRRGDGRVYAIITASDGNFTYTVDVNEASLPTRHYIDRFKGTYTKDAKSPVTITITSYNTNAGFDYPGSDNWVAPGSAGQAETVVATITGNQLTITHLTTATFIKQ
jgi:hypothetical protein